MKTSPWPLLQRTVFGISLGLASCTPPNAPPSAPVISLTPSAPKTADDLKVAVVTPSVDPEGKAVSYAYTWLKDGAPQADLVTDTVPGDRTRKGEAWSVLVTPSDGKANGTAGTAGVTVGNTLPSVAVAFTPESPTAATGLTVVPTATDADDDKVTFTYAWTKNSQATAFVDAAIPAAELKRGDTWKVTVTPNDGAAGEAASATVTVANALPEVASLVLNPTEPTKANTLFVVPGAVTDADKDATTLKYAWTVNGTEVAGQTGSALAAQHFKKGDTVVATVRANDGTADGPALTATTTILNAPPSVAGVAISPASGGKGDTFSCTPSGWSDLDGDAEGYAYEWKVGSASVGTAATLSGAGLTKGQALTCTVTPTDGTSSGTPRTSSAVTVANTPPTLAAVVLSPSNPTKADTLTATPAGFSDLDGDAEGYLYTWKRNGSVISGQGGPTLGGANFAKNQVITVEVRPFDGTSAGSAVVSNAVTVVNSPPQLASVTLAPSGGGTPVRGTALVASSTGVTDADGDVVTVRHEWTVNGAAVQGVSGNILSGMSFSRGDTVAVVATPDDGTLSGLPVVGSAVTIQNAPPSAPGVGITPANPQDVDDLVCSITTPSTDADGDAVTYAFTWTKNGQPAVGATPSSQSSVVAGALTAVGEEWQCTASASDSVAHTDTTVKAVVQAPGWTWQLVDNWPLTTMPSGVINLGGANGSRGIASIYGRTALVLGSDWNCIFLPHSLGLADAAIAVEGEAYVPDTSQSFGLGLLFGYASQNYLVGYTDRGVVTGMTPWIPDLGASVWPAGASGWTDVRRWTPPSAVAPGRWVKARLELERLDNQTPALYRLWTVWDGVRTQEWEGRLNWGSYIQLGGGHRSGGTAAVAWSNIKTFRGTR